MALFYFGRGWRPAAQQGLMEVGRTIGVADDILSDKHLRRIRFAVKRQRQLVKRTENEYSTDRTIERGFL